MRYLIFACIFLSLNCHAFDAREYFNERIDTLLSKKLISIKESQYLRPNSSIERYDGMIFATTLGAKEYDGKAFVDRFSVHQLSDFVTFDKNTETFAKAGDVKSMYYLALHYLDRDATCKEGVYWLEKAYQKRLVMAAFLKGRLMHTGRCGFKESLKDAIKMYEIGLAASEPRSIDFLSILLGKGLYVLNDKHGVQVDENDLLNLAANYGSPTAYEALASNLYRANKYDLSYTYCLLAYSSGSDNFLGPLNALKRIKNSKLTTNKTELERFKKLAPYRYYSFGYAEYFDGDMYF